MHTELRVAWRQGLERGLGEHKTEVVPYKILPPAVESVKQVVASSDPDSGSEELLLQRS
jgi:fructose-bisphosphate aldolase class II